MSKDFKLNSSWDIEFINGQLAFTNESESLIQRIRQRVSTFRGEWFLDESLGIPYFEDIFIKDYDLSRIEAIYINELQRIDGVAEILSLDIAVDDKKRELSIQTRLRESETGEIIELVI